MHQRLASCALTSLCLMLAASTATAQYQYHLLDADGRPIRYLLDSNEQGDLIGSVPNDATGLLDGFMQTAGGVTSFWSTPGFLAYPTSINNAGMVVGVNIPVPAAPPQGFIRTPAGVEAPYDFPGSFGTIPFGINNHDVISGFYVTADGRKGFVENLSGTLSRTVEFPGAAETQLYALNDAGLAGGAWFDVQGVISPFLYDIHIELFDE